MTNTFGSKLIGTCLRRFHTCEDDINIILVENYNDDGCDDGDIKSITS